VKFVWKIDVVYKIFTQKALFGNIILIEYSNKKESGIPKAVESVKYE
jgi:hypothetical protein